MQVDVLTSGIWQTNSTILSSRGSCVVVDPAYFPRELEAIAARVRELGQAAAVIFTHGHWDHVMGHTALPGAAVHVSSVLAESIAAGDPRAAKYLADAREFDLRWYVPRPRGYGWPGDLRRVVEAERTEIGGIALRTLHLPGHSPDGLGLVAGDVLLVGDYLSPCEIPFVEDALAYRATLARLLDVVSAVAEVIPGHGPRMSAREAAAIAREDLEYLDRMLAAPDLATALEAPLPRAADVPGMRDHHRDNCAAALRRSPSQGS
ncbi:MAG TPA: MBL fold metallo-hydrolase [Kofleriaceae bacterium]|nr:MBL fold metallo-hydrolase [Kofleriaceae bacterium]